MVAFSLQKKSVLLQVHLFSWKQSVSHCMDTTSKKPKIFAIRYFKLHSACFSYSNTCQDIPREWKNKLSDPRFIFEILMKSKTLRKMTQSMTLVPYLVQLTSSIKRKYLTSLIRENAKKLVCMCFLKIATLRQTLIERICQPCFSGIGSGTKSLVTKRKKNMIQPSESIRVAKICHTSSSSKVQTNNVICLRSRRPWNQAQESPVVTKDITIDSIQRERIAIFKS